jgi:hypothetical protein
MAKRVPGHPPPAGPLAAKLKLWGKGRTMHRVHESAYGADMFNPSADGNARFSPIHDPNGKIIPTLYAATSVEGALMETVFHDVPYKGGLKTLSKERRLGDKLYSTLTFHADFQLIDLSKIALRKLGVKPEHLINTTKAHYPRTRQWAEALYAQYPAAQGLLWTSRQDDRSLAVVLFQTRVQTTDLSAKSPSIPLIESGTVWAPVDVLATELGVILL